jgi:8-oxo-dGTP pyrophosphatase MutT (NUDIX family)
MAAGGAGKEIRAAIAACSAAIAAVRALPTPQSRIKAAGQLAEHLRALFEDVARIRHDEVIRIHEQEEGLSYAQIAERTGISKARVAQIIVKAKRQKAADARRQATSAGEPMIESPATPEPQPVVAAIVTSELGVLITQRNDGKPPYGFPSGEIEPGESPEDAGVREVKEETGMLVRAVGVIGRRVHPKTGRTMVYMKAEPAHGLDVFVGDEDELAAVLWVSLAEAERLLPGMFEPVHGYLTRTLT